MSIEQLPKIVIFWANHHDGGYEYAALYHILWYTSPVLEELVIISPDSSEDIYGTGRSHDTRTDRF